MNSTKKKSAAAPAAENTQASSAPALEGELLPPEVVGNERALGAPREAQNLLTVARSFAIDSPATFQAAGSELVLISRKLKDVKAQEQALLEPHREGERRVRAFFRPVLSALEEADRLLRLETGRWQEAERKRLDEERRASEARARAEREAAEKEAQERARAAQEAREKAARLEAEGKPRRAEKAAQEAERLESAAIESEAQAVTAALAPPPPVAGPTRVAGVSFRGVWKAEVQDKRALLAFALENPTYLNLVEVNEAALGQLARALKSSANIPGVRIYEQATPSVRGAR